MSETYDVIVVGSGAGAFVAAIRAASLGAKTLMLEKLDQFGGTSAMSGGGLWIPNNPAMHEVGVEDSDEDAFDYLRAVIPENQISDAVIQNYVKHARKALAFMIDETPVRYRPVPGYADYYPAFPGWKDGARTMDPLPVDGRKLGRMLSHLHPTPPQSQALGRINMSIVEGMQILAKAPGSSKLTAKLLWTYFTDIEGRLNGKRDRRLTQGNALIGGLYLGAMEKGIELRLSSPVSALLKDGGRVVGVKLQASKSSERTVLARRAVIVASGGFEHNGDLRRASIKGETDPAWSAGNPGNTGDLHEAGRQIGAALGLMHEAWWAPVVKWGDRSIVLFSEKSKPHLMIVDRAGKRFMNESITYNSYGECIYDARKAGHENIPAFVILDAEYRRKYPFAGLAQGEMMPDWMQSKAFGKSGVLTRASSLEELADALGIDADGLKTSAAQMNAFAASGVDEDFGRGGDAHDRTYGDQAVTPNPCLGSIAEAPFYGARVYPGDIGTKGGLVIDTEARVLDETGTPIEGLFAAGNCTSSIMGNKYPGAGCTLGPAITMAYIAASHTMGATP